MNKMQGKNVKMLWHSHQETMQASFSQSPKITKPSNINVFQAYILNRAKIKNIKYENIWIKSKSSVHNVKGDGKWMNNVKYLAVAKTIFRTSDIQKKTVAKPIKFRRF